ncbi:MAG: hypothetical protein MUD16_00730 [Desulfobacterales bacterium]|jgi:hypothetical protein|nr:hypothetical protein [Desulfobacterales bacterium]
MKPEHFQIHQHSIPFEIYESELTEGRKDKNPITLLTFIFKELPPPLLDEIAARLWGEVAKRYLALKKESLAKSNGEVIGRISFECSGTRVEYEFSRLTREVLQNLARLGEFVKQYPETGEIRASRDGPILVRFRNRQPEDPSLRSVAEKKRRWAKGCWMEGLSGSMFRRWRSRS